METIPADVLTTTVARTPPDHFIIWTGQSIVGQPGSLRSQALACVSEVATPVPLRILLQRAAHLADGAGYDPATVKSAVRLHQAAKPAVYLLVRRLRSGEGYVAVIDIPFPGGRSRIAEGELVMDGQGRFAWDRLEA